MQPSSPAGAEPRWLSRCPCCTAPCAALLPVLQLHCSLLQRSAGALLSPALGRGQEPAQVSRCHLSSAGVRQGAGICDCCAVSQGCSLRLCTAASSRKADAGRRLLPQRHRSCRRAGRRPRGWDLGQQGAVALGKSSWKGERVPSGAGLPRRWQQLPAVPGLVCWVLAPGRGLSTPQLGQHTPKGVSVPGLHSPCILIRRSRQEF